MLTRKKLVLIIAIVVVVAAAVTGVSMLNSRGAQSEYDPVSDNNTARESDSPDNIGVSPATADGVKETDSDGNVFAPEVIKEDGKDYVILGEEKIEIKETTQENQKLLEAAGAKQRTVEFKKEGVSSLRCKINGVESVFTYQKSQKTIIPSEFSLDDTELSVVQDCFVNEKGYSAIKYEGSDILNKFGTNYFGPVDGEQISIEEAKTIARNIALNTDLGIAELEHAKASARNGGGNRYQITFSAASGNITVALDFTGGLQWISVEKNAADAIAGERKQLAESKMVAKLEEMRVSNPNARIELAESAYVFCGSNVLAKFSVVYYPEQDNEASSVYQYFCFA